MQIIDGVAVRVVVEALAQLAQPLDLGRLESQRLRGAARRLRKVVAERRDYRPDAPASRQVAVDDEARADVGGGVYERPEIGMVRNSARVVVVKIAATGAVFEDTLHGARVGLEGNIKHRKFVPARRLHPFDQSDFAFCPGDEHTLPRLFEPQLLQGADAVRVAVEDVIELHAKWIRSPNARNDVESPAQRRPRRLARTS